MQQLSLVSPNFTGRHTTQIHKRSHWPEPGKEAWRVCLIGLSYARASLQEASHGVHLKPSVASARPANGLHLQCVQMRLKASVVDSVGDFLQACSCLAAQLTPTSSTGIYAWRTNNKMCCAIKPGWPTTRTLIEVVAHAQDEVWLLRVGNLSHQGSNSCLILHSFPAPITHLHIHAGCCQSLDKCVELLRPFCADHRL